MWGTEHSKIVGATIDLIEHDDNSVTITATDGRKFRYETDAGCCSSTWIEHITAPDYVRGGTITEVKEIDLDSEESAEYDFLQKYQTSFVTEKGEIIVEYRNSSNGYYGGWLSGPTVSEPKAVNNE